MDKKIYIIDVDKTICTGGYQDAQPIKERIEYFNKLYDNGHTVNYWTARGSSTGLDWFQHTKDQLISWGVKFHSFKVGKPTYDVWIDDKAINPDDIDYSQPPEK